MEDLEQVLKNIVVRVLRRSYFRFLLFGIFLFTASDRISPIHRLTSRERECGRLIHGFRRFHRRVLEQI